MVEGVERFPAQIESMTLADWETSANRKMHVPEARVPECISLLSTVSSGNRTGERILVEPDCRRAREIRSGNGIRIAGHVVELATAAGSDARNVFRGRDAERGSGLELLNARKTPVAQHISDNFPQTPK